MNMPIGGKDTIDARNAIDEMVDSWQLQDIAKTIPGAALNTAEIVVHYVNTFTREQFVTALSYATRTIALLRNDEIHDDASR